jgi:hypothetical protein
LKTTHDLDAERDELRSVIEAAHRRRGLPPPQWSDEQVRADSKADIHRRWAWMALGAGNVAAAKKHARLAFLANPFGVANVRVLLRAVLGG